MPGPPQFTFLATPLPGHHHRTWTIYYRPWSSWAIKKAALIDWSTDIAHTELSEMTYNVSLNLTHSLSLNGVCVGTNIPCRRRSICRTACHSSLRPALPDIDTGASECHPWNESTTHNDQHRSGRHLLRLLLELLARVSYGHVDTSPSPGFSLRVVCHSYKLHPTSGAFAITCTST